MALTSEKVKGVRTISQLTSPTITADITGIRNDFLAEMYGEVETFGDLPASDNWKGRRRWVNSLSAFAVHDGDGWYMPTARLSLEAFRDQAQTVSNSGYTEMFFGTPTRNTGGYVIADRRFQVPVAGWYDIEFDITWPASTTGSARSVKPTVNGAVPTGPALPEELIRQSGFPNATLVAHGRFMIAAASGDQLGIACGHNASVTLSVGDRMIKIRYAGPI